MNTALVIDVNFAIALVMTILGIVLYEIAPPADDTTQTRAKHAILGFVAFVLLWLVQAIPGDFVITPAIAFAFFSAGLVPNEILDLYQKYTNPTPA